MTGDEREKYVYEFATKMIFERRKTQYQIFFFYLIASGSSFGIVLNAQDPSRHYLVLLIPIFLQLPLYNSWLDHRAAIDRHEKVRRDVLRGDANRLPKFQSGIGHYSNDFVFIFVPLASAVLYFFLNFDILQIESVSKYAVSLLSFSSTFISLVALIRYDRKKRRSASGG